MKPKHATADRPKPKTQVLHAEDWDAAVFDLDGVVTRTARVHAAAWKRLFDDFLSARSEQTGEPFRPFDIATDYPLYVDGKPRLDGVTSFLQSRGIDLPWGTPSDGPDSATICGLGNQKDGYFHELLAKEGVEVFDTSIRFIRALQKAGIKTALVSSSRNAEAILGAAGLGEMFEARIDGNDLARLGLRGKPAPDLFVLAAERLGVPRTRAIVLEDAISGVEAGRAGGFGLVIGVDRRGQPEALRRAGADIVVSDLGLLKVTGKAQPVTAPSAAMDRWTLCYEGFDRDQEGLRETLCTLGNGYFATRGAAEEASADETHYPGTYLAGGYNRLQTNIAGRVIENEDLVNLPNWLPLTVRAKDGDWLNLQREEVLAYRQEMDLKRGVLTRRFRVRDKDGRETSIISRRLVSMHNPHLAALQVSICAENWSGEAEILSALDGRVVNAGVTRYQQLNSKHLAPVRAGPIEEDGLLLVVETNQSGLRIAQAARTRVFQAGALIPAHRQTDSSDGYVAQTLHVELVQGEALTVEKVVSLYTGRDKAISEPSLAATKAIAEAGSFALVLADHTLAWSQLWARGDITLKDSSRIQMILRLHIFHLLQTVSPHTTELDVGVPARGLHGEAYRGHIFWDELFILPFLNFRLPEISRALLRYRYRRLPEARRLARANELPGAMYPWQSGSSGREESQVLHLNPRSGRWTPDNTYLQRHVNAAIALNIWRYHQATGDDTFLACYGAEMFVEIARLFAGLATYNEELERYEILGVMGPDEFHDAYPWRDKPGLDNNAYTSVMASWVLRQAAQVLDLLHDDRRRELADTLRLGDDELALWDEIGRKLRVVFDEDGVIMQFEGYDRLKDLDWNAYAEKYGDIHRLDRILEAEGDSVNRYKASKQADVLMLFYLFSSGELRQIFKQLDYPFSAKTIHKCIAYYLPRTSNGSTLSRIVHSWVLARSNRTRSWQLLKEALESDISDIQGGTTAEGIHLGAMAGTEDLVQRGQTALEIVNGVLHLSPCMPHELQGMRLRLLYQGSRLDVDVSREKVIFSAPEDWAGPQKIGVRNRVHVFKAGDRLEFDCHFRGGGWRPIVNASKRKKSRAAAKA